MGLVDLVVVVLVVVPVAVDACFFRDVDRWVDNPTYKWDKVSIFELAKDLMLHISIHLKCYFF